jgi:hypothetical protein
MDKAYVLEEIRRTTAANGGVPLGWRRFLAETGIREADWLGVHRARWSDALREAGFTPNRLNSAYTSTELLDKLAGFVLDIGRLPNRGDFRLRDGQDPSFPNPKTFSRLGGKAELIAKLAEHCRGREELAKVSTLCEEYLAAKPSTTAPVRRTDGEMGYVYLLKSGRFYKIGRSNAVGRREYELQLQLPEPAKLLHRIQTDDPLGIEAYWHRRFAAKHKNGEWFDLDSDDVAAFRRRKFM